jgi:putative ABC transport system permease protein
VTISTIDSRPDSGIPSGPNRTGSDPASRDPVWLAWRLCRRELRAGSAGFRIFLACLALGVAAIAGVGSVSQSIVAGLNADARVLLGGEVDLRLTHRPASAEQLTWLRENGRVSAVAEIRTMARNDDRTSRRLIELKAVDENYPLFGELMLSQGGSLTDALARREDVWSAVADAGLAERLGLTLGDLVRVGETKFRVTDIIEREPDRSSQILALGPRLMIPLAAIAETGLIKPGSLFHYHYRIAIDEPVDKWSARLNERFGNAGWRIRDFNNAAPGIQRFVDRVTLFLTLVGLTALLVGGVGVGNAVNAYLQSKTETIATLKCLGASRRLIFRTYMLHIIVLSLIGIALGLTVGALAPLAARPLITDYLPVTADIRIYPMPLILALTFGMLVAILFSLWPLSRAQKVPAGSLFRNLVAPINVWPSPKLALTLGLVAAMLAGLAIASADNRIFALYFVAGAAASFVAFRFAAILVIRVSRVIPRPRHTGLRIAIVNLHRPGAPTSSVILSLGLGLTVLVAVVLIEGNISRQVGETLLEDAPGFYFIDLQTDQTEVFDALVSDFPGVHKIGRVPMLRGRITKIAGTPVDQITSPPDYAWITRGDRGLTWMRQPPASGSKVVAGEWWPADYSGPPLISFDAEAARAFGIGIGDTLHINILGREIEAEIANLRLIDWNTLGINFVIVFSPGWLEAAPQTHIATTHLDAASESGLETAVTDRFPNISAIRVREVLSNINSVVAKIGTAVRSIAALAIVAGTLVLAGAIAASHKRRVYDAVIFKVLGATRRDIVGAFIMEFLLLGLITAIISAMIGSIAAWAVVVWVMEADWAFIPGAVAATTVLCTLLTVTLGLVGTWHALGQKAAPLLRNE